MCHCGSMPVWMECCLQVCQTDGNVRTKPGLLTRRFGRRPTSQGRELRKQRHTSELPDFLSERMTTKKKKTARKRKLQRLTFKTDRRLTPVIPADGFLTLVTSKTPIKPRNPADLNYNQHRDRPRWKQLNVFQTF